MSDGALTLPVAGAVEPPAWARRFGSAEALERHLGDPRDPATPFSFAAAVELDEREAYPEVACGEIERFGLGAFYVPAACGGRLVAFDELCTLIRVVARRDLTVAIAHSKTFLGAISVWLAGSSSQQERAAALILGGCQIALGLTEREHGSDLLANEVLASRAPAGGYVVSGEKWLINNATRGAAITLYARTEATDGPRAFSLFFVDKERLDPGSYAPLPKVLTLGIRGADISGIGFARAWLPESSRIGPPGGGLECTLRGFQVTRTLCAALSLGAGDTALRTVLDYSLARRMYGAPLYDIPHVRETLVNAFVDLLICDCVTLAACRGLHTVPEQMSTWSSIVKYFVPATIETMARELSLVLGARYFLREGHGWGMFQKLLRDNALVGLFDGSSIVNLRAVGLQLAQMVRRRRKVPRPGDDAELAVRLRRTLRLDEPLPALDLTRLVLTSKGRDDLMAGLDAAWEELAGEPGEEAAVIVARLRELLAVRRELDAGVEILAATVPFDDSSPELFELARLYSALHAAAACIGIWRHGRGLAGSWWEGSEWLLLALDRLLATCGRAPLAPAEKWHVAAAERMLALYHDDELFSILPVRLGGRK